MKLGRLEWIRRQKSTPPAWRGKVYKLCGAGFFLASDRQFQEGMYKVFFYCAFSSIFLYEKS